MSDGISISGSEQVLARLNRWIEKKSHQINNRIQEAGAKTEAGAKQRAPVKTGRFRDGYTYEKTGESSCKVSNAVPYGPFLECGTSRMRAHPSLFPAFASESKDLLRDLKDIVEK